VHTIPDCFSFVTRFLVTSSPRWDVFLGGGLGQTPASQWRTSLQTPTAPQRTERVPTWRTPCCPAWPAPSLWSPTSESPRFSRSSCSSSSLSPTPSSWRPAAIAKPWGKTGLHVTCRLMWGKKDVCLWSDVVHTACLCSFFSFYNLPVREMKEARFVSFRGGFLHSRGYDPVLAAVLFSGALALHSRQLDLKLRLDYLWATRVCLYEHVAALLLLLTIHIWLCMCTSSCSRALKSICFPRLSVHGS